MNPSILFRKKAALTEDGLDWLRGGDEFNDLTHCARRNTSGRVGVSAILVRALLAVLDGNVTEAGADAGGHAVLACVRSKTSPGAVTWCWVSGLDYAFPHGDEDKATYHLGVLWILQALANPAPAADFWAAYADLQAAYQRHGKQRDILAPLVRAADESYYWGRFFDQDPADAGTDRFPDLRLMANTGAQPSGLAALELAPLTDPAALARLIGAKPKAKAKVAKNAEPVLNDGGFVGWQVKALTDALHAGLNALLAGPTGTGKTFAVQQAVLAESGALVTVEGKEGLTDLDFLGAILPQADGARRWVDGPVLRALRQAQYEPVVLFLDEINRIRREYLNLLLGLMNAKPLALCERQGIAVEGAGPFYLIEVPMMSEVVVCPCAHLRFIGAGNFGADYAVYPLDPAVRRRFDLVLDFDYLPLDAEQALVEARAGLKGKVAHALCLVAQYTRQMRRNGDLPGCVDTASLLMWARLCAEQGAETVADVMRLGRLTWADLACGRDHLGLLRLAKYDGLTDYLVAQSVLPRGKLDE